MTSAKYKSDNELKKYTPYLTLTGELWSVFYWNYYLYFRASFVHHVDYPNLRIITQSFPAGCRTVSGIELIVAKWHHMAT